MQAAALFDGFSFDAFFLFENDQSFAEVDVGRRQVVQALEISAIVVVRDDSPMLSSSWPTKRHGHGARNGFTD